MVQQWTVGSRYQIGVRSVKSYNVEPFFCELKIHYLHFRHAPCSDFVFFYNREVGATKSDSARSFEYIYSIIVKIVTGTEFPNEEEFSDSVGLFLVNLDD